jgi:hypothetical protein
MKVITLTEEEFSLAVDVIRFLHRNAKTPEEKTDKFLIEKFGEKSVELAKRLCKEMPTAEEIEQTRKEAIEKVLKKYKKR